MEPGCCQENKVPVEFDHHRYIRISGEKTQENLPCANFASWAAVEARWSCLYVLIQDHAASLQEIFSDTAV